MEVYEIKLKVYTLIDINVEDAQNEVCKLIDSALIKNTDFLEFHKKNEFKNYCFDSLYPIEESKIYQKDKIYSVKVRTINRRLAKYLNDNLSKEYSDKLKSLTTEIRIVPKKIIEKIYSITPVILKDSSGYWKENLRLDDFERRLKENLIKKYNQVNETKVDENFDLYTSIEFKNKKPCKIKYKNINLLGDKISLNISDNNIAQNIAYMALGTGVLEFNSRGGGFVNFRCL